MSAASEPLRVAIVPGVIIGKWTRAWQERTAMPISVTPVDEADQRSVLTQRAADICFMRLPVEQEGLSVVRLYSETAVVVAPREHPISAFDAVTLADLSGETVRLEPLTDAIDLVVAGVGIVIAPQSVARQHARKDLVARPITDAPETEIAVVWLSEETTPEIEEFVGIVRGRKAGSSRGPTRVAAERPGSPATQPTKKSTSGKSGTRQAVGRPKPSKPATPSKRSTRGKKPRGGR